MSIDTMFTLIYLARRNPALLPEEFSQAWREHSALGRLCPNVQAKVTGVSQCSRVLDSDVLPGASPDYDGVNLLELRDLQAASDIWNDPDVRQVMYPDELRVFDGHVRDFSLVSEALVLKDAPRSAIAVISFLRRREGIGRAEFSRCWEQEHAPLLLACPAFRCARRYVQNHVVMDPPPGYDYDGIAELWFESLQEVRSAFADADAGMRIGADLARFSDPARSITMLTRLTHARP